MHVRLLLTLSLLLIGLTGSAQDSIAPARPLLRQFYTQRMQAQIEQNEVVLETRSALERQTEESKRTKPLKQYTIPVVFHILYASGQAYPSGDQVARQLESLNRDFGAAEYDSKHSSKVGELDVAVADTEITFCVPAKDPNGKKTEGVNYVPIEVGVWPANNDMKNEVTGGASPWAPDRYLNVWVVHLPDSISGWAQMPGGPAGTDGIVIDYRFFGTGGTAVSPYDEGKTLTHLVGNYLNLYDLWDERNVCGDDYVEDTPVHNGPNFYCFENELHVSLCADNPQEMWMNFMDNTPDACMYMFTLGQKQRMQTVLLEGGARSGLVEEKVQCGQVKRTHVSQESVVLGSDTTSSKISSTVSSAIKGEHIAVRLYPNPTATTSQLLFDLPEAVIVRIVVYDHTARHFASASQLNATA